MRSIKPVKTSCEVENGEGRGVIEKNEHGNTRSQIKEAAEEGA